MVVFVCSSIESNQKMTTSVEVVRGQYETKICAGDNLKIEYERFLGTYPDFTGHNNFMADNLTPRIYNKLKNLVSCRLIS